MVDLGIATDVIYFIEYRKRLSLMQNLGIPIHKYCKQSQLSTQKALSYAADTIEALANFHKGLNSHRKQRRLHNVIKKYNILINLINHKISIIDFGEGFDISEGAYSLHKSFQHPIAKSFEPDLATPEIQNHTGPGYLPWQIYKHDRRFYNEGSDVYLLASVLEPLATFHPIIKQFHFLILNPNPTLRIDLETALLVIRSAESAFKKFNLCQTKV